MVIDKLNELIMTRKILTDAVAEAAEQCGFSFHTGFEYRLASELKRVPAVWLNPPELEKTEGRNEYMNAASVSWLAGIMAAPRVWIAAGTVYTPVDVVGGDVIVQGGKQSNESIYKSVYLGLFNCLRVSNMYQ